MKTLPPLRERREDILPLARHLMQRHLRGGEVLPPFAPEAEARLLSHHWPGNVRELNETNNITQTVSISGSITVQSTLNMTIIPFDKSGLLGLSQ